jgi:hypothetical protein
MKEKEISGALNIFKMRSLSEMEKNIDDTKAKLQSINQFKELIDYAISYKDITIFEG